MEEQSLAQGNILSGTASAEGAATATSSGSLQMIKVYIIRTIYQGVVSRLINRAPYPEAMLVGSGDTANEPHLNPTAAVFTSANNLLVH